MRETTKEHKTGIHIESRALMDLIMDDDIDVKALGLGSVVASLLLQDEYIRAVKNKEGDTLWAVYPPCVPQELKGQYATLSRLFPHKTSTRIMGKGILLFHPVIQKRL